MINSSAKLAHGGNVWAAAQKWGKAPQEFLDYSANINPLGPCPASLKAIEDSLGLLVHYPEPTGETLKTSLGNYLHVASENMVLGNGGSELIYLLGRMYGNHRVLCLAPTFSEYGEGIESPRIIEIPLSAGTQFQLPTEKILASMQAGDLVFLGNPNNPTGTLFPRQELIKIVEGAAEAQAMVVIDEAFIDFVGDESCSLRDLAANHPQLIVIGSLTKFFAIPALRLGYAVAAGPISAAMERLLPTWRINTLAQAAALAAIDDQVYQDESIRLIQAERAFLTAELQNIKGLQVYPSATNFMLIDGQGTGITAAELQARLGPKGILIRQCDTFHNLSPFYFRLAVKNRSDNRKLVAAVQEVLGLL